MLVANATLAVCRVRIAKCLLLSFLLLLTCLCIDALHVYVATASTVPRAYLSPPETHNRPVPDRVFIASLQWNTSYILRSHWSRAILDLTEVLGPSNVYFSAYASESPDDTKEALDELDKALETRGVRRSIVYDGRNHSKVIDEAHPEDGWVKSANGTRHLRRIPYLAHLRNLSFQPLIELAKQGETFNKIIFLNDVVFQPQDVVQLLNTNNGQYAAACSMDFANPPDFYDTFALFDSEGHQYWTRTWPYFRSPLSRHALMGNIPVPVKSCWNGMVVFDTSPFYSLSSPLNFRAIPDTLAQTHVEASECCLIHADNAFDLAKGVFVNPNVRLGYDLLAYETMQRPLSFLAAYGGVWHNRFRRWFTTALRRDWFVTPRLERWAAEMEGNVEAGDFCLVDEMQILTPEGWTHL